MLVKEFIEKSFISKPFKIVETNEELVNKYFESSCKCNFDVNYLFTMPRESDAIEFIKDREVLMWIIKDDCVMVVLKDIEEENNDKSTNEGEEVKNGQN